LIVVHLLALTRDRDGVLAIHTDAGWLLPRAEHAGQSSTLASAIDAVLRRLSATAQIIHWAPLASGAGGASAGPGAVDRQMYAIASLSGPVVSSGAKDTPFESLLSTPALLPVQRDAVQTAVSRLRAPRLPFDSEDQVAAALEWATRAIAATGAQVIAAAAHRCARSSRVVRFDTTVGRMYLKAGRGRASDEARLCDLLAAIAPRRFPTTAALDTDQECWLYHAMEGEPLTGSRLSVARAMAAVDALVDLQKRTMTAAAIKTHLSTRCLRAQDLMARVCEAIERIWHDDAGPIEQWRTFIGLATRSCARLDELDVPLTLAFSDFWTENILMTPDGIGFIDVENAYWTFPFVPLWRFGRDVDRQLRTGGIIRRRLEQRLVEAWADTVDRRVMTQALAGFPLLGRLFGLLMASADLDRYEQELGGPLPASYRATQLRARLMSLMATPGLCEPLPRHAELA
jgi:hypothetical protein